MLYFKQYVVLVVHVKARKQHFYDMSNYCSQHTAKYLVFYSFSELITHKLCFFVSNAQFSKSSIKLIALLAKHFLLQR